MVEVDVFWAYGLGAGFAAAATHQIARGDADAVGPTGWPRWFSPYFTVTVLYLALFFAPSGVYLLWHFPDWETMQVARDHSSLPAWLVTVFAVTNVSQGVLGYWVTQRLIRAGRRYAAFLQTFVGYFGMFFILVHGWDGRGYQRFFSADRSVFETWPRNPSFGDAMSRAGHWVSSPVALTLAAMGVIVVVLLWIMSDWLRAGYRRSEVADPPGVPTIIAALLGVVFIGALGSAIVASVLIHLLGWFIGVPLAAALIWLGVLRPRNSLCHWFFDTLRLSGSAEPLGRDAADDDGRRLVDPGLVQRLGGP